MWENLIQKDKELLIYLNNLGSEQWDFLWLAITNQFNWIPLFLLIIILTFKAFGWKKGLVVVLVMIALVAFSDQFTNFIKDFFLRLRPTVDTTVNTKLRISVKPGTHSFYSGHAATSSAFSIFTILLLKHKYKYIWLLLMFPLIFGYSRLYLGVHFPIDVLTGYVAGTIVGTLFYFLFCRINQKFLI